LRVEGEGESNEERREEVKKNYKIRRVRRRGKRN
jgi:hypothetical protein